MIFELLQPENRAALLKLTDQQVAFELQTDSRDGLSSMEACRRLATVGANVLRKGRKIPWPVKLLTNFFSFFAVLLWIAALLCFIPGVDMPQLGFAIGIVILINGFFSFLQEQKSDKAVETLQAMMSPRCRVVREGTAAEIEATELVPGDVILLDEGDIVPADARLIEADGVEVDNSTLTGESVSAPRYKSDRPIPMPGKFLWIELPNIVFAGTALLKGHARAIVFGTGMNSEVGKIAGLTQALRIEPSPLQKQLRSTVWAITGLASALGLGFLALGWFVSGLTFTQAFIFFIGIFVANVPEGLLPTVTLALAMGVTRMAKRHALVKSLPSVETLGCTTVICSDKTGTLTQNLMMVTHLWVDGRRLQISGIGYEPMGDLLLDGQALSHDKMTEWPALRRLLECAVFCNNARLKRSPLGTTVLGDPTEGALLALAGKTQLTLEARRIHLNAFESVRKRMSVVVEQSGNEKKLIFVKGAPLETLACCQWVHSQGQVLPLNEEGRRRVIEENDRLAKNGLRVLALAYREGVSLEQGADFKVDDVEKDLVFAGLAALSDPVRPGVPKAIGACHTAGIRVLMITGDYALTAASIGRQIGLGTGAELNVFAGSEIADMTDAQLKAILVHGETIFARVIPEHKLRIVSLLKDMGEVVAVTGDGVNDAPALKKADIGIAMGLRGHDVAKEAAHMILTDDNFGSIVAAIEEGRAIFDNIKRFMTYVLSSNPQEMYPNILWMLVPGMPLAMTVMGVLAVDVGTDLIPAMGLGVEPPEKDVMERPPRRREAKLLSLGFILRAYLVQGSILSLSCFLTYYYMGWVLGVWRPGMPLSAMPASPAGLKMTLASTAYLQTLTAYFFPTVTTQIANVLCRRSWKTSIFSKGFLFSNRLVNLGIIVELFLCGLFFYTPLSRLYFFAPVPWHVYLFAFHGTLLLMVFEETKKYFRRRGHRMEYLG